MRSEFATLLNAERTEKKLGVRALARKLGVTPAFVCHLESGKAKPSVRMAAKIAHALKLSHATVSKRLGDDIIAAAFRESCRISLAIMTEYRKQKQRKRGKVTR